MQKVILIMVYAYRAAGGKVVIMPGYAGECQTRISRHLDANISDVALRDKCENKLLAVKKTTTYERAVYYRRHAGFLWPALLGTSLT